MMEAKSIADQILKFVADKIAPVLKTEADKLVNVPQLVSQMKHELWKMKDFLDKSEQEEDQSEDPIKKESVREVREIMFKIEDILDDYNLLLMEEQHIDDDHIHDQQQGHDDQYGCLSICRCLRRVICCKDDVHDNYYVPLEDDHDYDANNGLSEMMDKICGWLVRNDKGRKQFNRRYKIASTITRIKKEVEKMKKGTSTSTSYGENYKPMVEISECDTSKADHDHDHDHDDDQDPGIEPLYKDESELVGFDESKKEIIKLLDLDNSSSSSSSSKNGSQYSQQLVVVWGEPGVGKTTLVHKVYEDERVRRTFSVRLWISANTCYKRPVHLLRSLLNQFGVVLQGTTTTTSKYSESQQVIITTQLRNHLKGNQTRYLVVLDDVSEMEELSKCIKAIFIPSDSRNGGKILMTTNTEHVANFWKASMSSNGAILYNLRPLYEDDAVKLFDKKAFGDQVKCPWKLTNIRDNVVQYCNGSPFLIDKVGASFSTTHKWIELYRGFLSNPLPPREKRVFLSKTYYKLPSHLRPCFLYLAMFPKGKQVKRMKVVRLWIAEGFITRCHGNIKMLEEVADEYLNELIQGGMVISENDETGRPRLIRLPNFWHLLLLSKLDQLSFCQVLTQDHDMMYSGVNNNHPYRRLSVHDHVPDFNVPRSVRSILSFVSPQHFPISWEWPYQGFVFRLKVLDLQGAKFAQVPKELGVLHNLRYLSLRGTMVEEVEFIGELWNLQTLDLKGTKVDTLPNKINRLHKLRHLLVHRYERDKAMPVKIPNKAFETLEELQKLAFIDGSSVDIGKLGNLKQLRRLAITNLKKSDGKILCEALKEMKCLRSLSISSTIDDEILDLDHLDNNSYPKYLERLYLDGPLKDGVLPKWVWKLANLVKLRLRYSNFGDKHSLLKAFRKMDGLLVLELDQVYDGDTLDFGTAILPNLQVLRLRNLPNLNTIKASMHNEMSKLRHIKHHGCGEINICLPKHISISKLMS